MKLRLARLHYPVTVLGPGRRIGVWTQGCTIGCAGCISRDTWAADDDRLIDVDRVLAWFAEQPAGEIDGVTISGGEPSEQPDALAAMLTEIRRRPECRRWDVLCYTGVELDEFRDRCGAAYPLIDAVITGPYRAGEPTDLVWRGSANQKLVPLTERGRERFDSYVDRRTSRPALQVEIEPDGVRMIGVPRTGDLTRLERLLREQGITWEGASWRP